MSRKVSWFCMICWQEAETVVESHEERPNIAEIAPIRRHHAEIIKGVIGGAKCEGDIREPQPTKRPRVQRVPPPTSSRTRRRTDNAAIAA
jgi:hypothetical protein